MGCDICTDWDLVNLHFPSAGWAQQAVWLIGSFVGMVRDFDVGFYGLAYISSLV